MRCELFILAAPNFGKVQYENIPGTDLTYRGTQGQLEFDFLHHPGANQNTILIEFIGAKDILLSRSGELVVRTKYGQICFHQPAAYQLDQEARHMVAARYRQISKGRFGFAVGPYDVTTPPDRYASKSVRIAQIRFSDPGGSGDFLFPRQSVGV